MRPITTDARRVVSIAAVQPRAAETGATVARIELRKRGPIGEIRLNRPEVLNAMGREWPDDMLGAAREMQADPPPPPPPPPPPRPPPPPPPPPTHPPPRPPPPPPSP